MNIALEGQKETNTMGMPITFYMIKLQIAALVYCVSVQAQTLLI